MILPPMEVLCSMHTSCHIQDEERANECSFLPMKACEVGTYLLSRCSGARADQWSVDTRRFPSQRTAQLYSGVQLLDGRVAQW